MLVPIVLDGRTYTYQLDTGADVLIPYGKKPHASWRPAGKTVRIPKVRFAGMNFPAVLGYPQTQMSDDDVQGTVGLDMMVGQVFIIDFPKRRVCLMSHANAPGALLDAAQWTPGEIRHGHFFIDAQVGTAKISGLIFDTGSSPVGIDTDIAKWGDLTGRAEPVGTVPPVEEHVWGKTVHLIQAPARGELRLGGQSLPPIMVSTIVERPRYYAEEMNGSGVIGNAPFMHDIVILDLGSGPGLGVISPSVPETR